MNPFWINDGRIRIGLLLVLGLFGASGFFANAAPEPAGWYAGDMHVHQNCGGSRDPVTDIFNQMVNQDLAVLSLLADMGNDAIDIPGTPSNLTNVTGRNDPISTPGHILQWDAEWHWDRDDYQRNPSLYPHEALGGHILALGLTNANQMWVEYTYPVFQWAHRQGGIAGFAHMQYLGEDFPLTLTCCTPIEYPVEVGLGACDFVEEDVAGGDTAIHAYYRLLNCGLRPGFAGGSDYPCESTIGETITYVRVSGGSLIYSNWIRGIALGRTVVSRNGHNEFLDLKVNGTAGPGDEIQLTNAGNVQVTVVWTAQEALSGTIELVKNGVVVASLAASAAPGTPATLSTNINFTNSGWLCARRMSGGEHAVNTAAVFVTVNHAPVRASVADAQFYVQWMNNLLALTSPGGAWSEFFVTNRAEAQARYSAARAVYQQIALEAAALLPLTIDTAALPYGTVNTAYSTTLAAEDGVPPYTWSLVNGSLPPGLTLDTNSGAITGTPTVAGIFNFTIQVSDFSHPTQSTSKSLGITITSVPLTSLWPGSVVPGNDDGGPDIALELGVKFRSDVRGYITAIRFYKTSANTGIHIGDLWTSSGTLLASATFTGETASGWQQVNFVNPVLISSNTVYVASYHCNNGHYSEDDNYFSSTGVDNPPLHALANGVSGPNGVSAYGSGSVFPDQAYSSANYWVDVAFTTTNAIQTLTAISVSPTNLTLTTGGSQQYLATGMYSNGSPQDITSQVTWSSTNSAVATVNASGLVTAVAPGTTAISASLGGVSSNTLLRVQTGPLSINTTSLPNGIQNTSYTTTLGASGGTTPYTWSIISGALPGGLTLNTNSGAITGTAGSAGTFNFTVQVKDASQPVQTATQPLSITINSLPNTATIWSSNAVPGTADVGADSAVELGVKFRSDVSGYITGVRFYKSSANTGTHLGDLWTSNGTLLASATFSGETASGWQQVNFTSPVAINANTVYVGSYHCAGGHYNEDDNYFASSGVDNPPLHALADGVSGPDGVFNYGSGSTFPSQGFMAANYWVDVVFTGSLGPVLPVQTNRLVNELTTLTVTNTATDSSPVSYTLTVTNLGTGSAVTNASISTNGVISWTPSEAQGPGSNRVMTVVSDGSLSATNSFVVFVNEVNVAPVLPNQTNITINGLTPIVVTNTASDSDIPVNPLGYQLTGPTGSTIDANGVIRWTPGAGQVPGVYPFTTVVTDTNVLAVNAQDLSATNSFSVTVQAIHNASVLPNQTNQTVNELTLLVVTNTASENDVPALPLTYSLTMTNLGTGLSVTNASISTNGVISWTPSEAQGPGSNRVMTVVSDGSLSATNSFVVFVNEVNVAPVLPNQTNITISGTTPIVVTNTASDSDIPVNPLGYQLTGPTGSTIDANGVIRWTPAVGQVPGVYPFTTVVTDTNVLAVNAQDLSATNSFTVTVNAIHNAPVLPNQTNQVVNELTILVVTNTASENDIPALPLTYSLTVTNLGDGSGSTNATIDTNGVINWTPTEAQGPGTYEFITVATDGDLSATNGFVVTVNEVNVAPILPDQTTRTMDVLTTLTVTNTATDSDIPANTLTYMLTAAPTNAAIDSNGVITWMPHLAQGGTTNQFVTVVADDGLPSLSETNSFEVIVNPLPVVPAPVIQAITMSDGAVTLKWCCLSNCTYRLQYTEDLGTSNWTDVLPEIRATGSTATTTNLIGDATQRFYRVLLIP